MRWPTNSILLAVSLGMLGACERQPAYRATPVKQALPDKPAKQAAPGAQRKRECVERLLATAAPRDHGLLRSLCAEWENQAIPGLALAIVEKGQLRLHVELGVRCSGAIDPVDSNTEFRFGSISKTFTAALVLDSFDPAALETPVALPELVWPASMDPPTLAALLRHRSGLGEIAPDQIVAFAGAWKPALAHSPTAGLAGEWHYSNAGYVVVGALLEARLGQSYEAALQARFSATPTITSDPTRAHAPACGHLREPERMRSIPIAHDLDFMPGDPSWLRPTGGVLGTAEDLARFGAQLDPRMLVPGLSLPRDAWHHRGSDERYGLGLRSWVLEDGTQLFGHSGDTGTFSAELVVAPDRQIAIALVANGPMASNSVMLAIERSIAAD